jgi:hypothetical protein
MFAGMFSSEEPWWHLVSMAVPHDLSVGIQPGVLVGNAVCWLSPLHSNIIAYLLHTNELVLIGSLPTDSFGPYDCYQVVKEAAGAKGVGVAAVRGCRLHLFKLTADPADGTLTWTGYRVIELDTLLSPPLKAIEVSDEDGNTVFFETVNGVFALQLESMEVNKVLQCDMVCSSTMIAYRRLYM